MKFRRAVFILIVFVILAGIHLFVYTQNIDLKFKIRELKIKRSELLSKNRMLGSKVARKENPKQIEKIAKEKLGMIYPKDINYVILSKEARP